MSQVINNLCQYILANDIQSTRKILKDECSNANFDINAPNSKGYSALYCAAKKGFFDLTLLLLNSEKIDLDFQAKQDGNTPLHAASLKGHGLVVALLLIRGARVRIQNKSKITPRGVAKGDAVESFKVFETKGTHGLLEKNKQISQKIVEDFKAKIEYRDIIKLIGKEIPLFCCNVYLRDQFTSGVLILTTDRVAFCYCVDGKWMSVIFINCNLHNIVFDAKLSVKIDIKESFGTGVCSYKDVTIEFDKEIDKQFFKSYYRKSSLCLFEIRPEDRDEFYKLDYDFGKIYDRFIPKARTIDFNCKDSHENILIEYETGFVRAATFSKLIEKMTEESGCVDMDDFLISYRLFSESEEILQGLFMRYYQVNEKLKYRVFTVLQRWVDRFWNDFERNFATNTESVYKFVDPLIKQNNNEAKLVRKRIEQKSKEKFLQGLAPRDTSAKPWTPRQQNSTGSNASSTGSNPSTPSSTRLASSPSSGNIPRSTTTPSATPTASQSQLSTRSTPNTPNAQTPTGSQVASALLGDIEKGFFEFTPLEIANQWTLLEWGFWNRITDNEWNELGCTKKKNKLEIAPNICLMFKRSKQISDWVSTVILTEEKKKSRVLLLSKFIEIAECLRILGNYHGLMEIFKGLTSKFTGPALKSTFEAMNDTKVVKDWTNIVEIASSKNNFQEMRKAFASSQSSALPYLELYLSDVVSAIEKSGPFVNGLIHFNRCRMFASTIKEINQYQPIGFDSIQPVPFLQEFLLAPASLPDEQLAELGNFIEPKVDGAKPSRPDAIIDNYNSKNSALLGLRKDNSNAGLKKEEKLRKESSTTPKTGRGEKVRGKKGNISLLSPTASPSKSSLSNNANNASATSTPAKEETRPANKLGLTNFEIPPSEEKTVDSEILYLRNVREKLKLSLEQEYGDTIFLQEKYHGLCLFSPRLLAEQITYRDQQNFVQLLASDELYNLKNWSKPLHSPTLTAVSEYFDKLSCAILTEILTERNNAIRQYLISVVIETMVELLNLQNLHSLLSFWTALSSTSIARLYQPFTPLIMRLIEELQSPSNNYKNIRDYISNIQKSQTTPTLCIPYLGLYQKDLIYATEVDNSNANSGKNLSNEIIDSLKLLLSVPCTIQPNAFIQKYIQNVYYLDDLDKLYKLSMELEPRKKPLKGTLNQASESERSNDDQKDEDGDGQKSENDQNSDKSLLDIEIGKKQAHHNSFHEILGAYLIRDSFLNDTDFLDFEFPVEKGTKIKFHSCIVRARCFPLVALRDNIISAEDGKALQYSTAAIELLKMFVYKNQVAIRNVPVDTISELWAVSIQCNLNNLIALIKMYIMNEITVSNIVDYMNCFRKWKIPDQDVFLHTAIEKLANSTLVKNVIKKEKERKIENIAIETSFLQDFQRILSRDIHDITIDVVDIFGATKKFNICKALVCKNSGYFLNLANTEGLVEKITTDVSLPAFEAILQIISLQGHSTHRVDITPLDLFLVFECGSKFEVSNWELVLQDIISRLRRISKNETEEVINFIYRTYELNILQRFSVIFDQLSFYNNNILKLSNFTKKKIADTFNIIMSITPLLKERDKEIEMLKAEREKSKIEFQTLRNEINELRDLLTS